MEKVRAFDEEKAKKDTFLDIYRKIAPLIANEKYAEAQREIKKELSILAGALGGPADERLRGVREEFEVFLPEEVRWLLNVETPEARARTGRKKAEEMEAQIQERAKREREFAEDMPEAMGSEREKINTIANKKTWEVPELDEIKPGLIIEIQDVNSGAVEKYEILNSPYRYHQNDVLWVGAFNLKFKYHQIISLAEKGIIPDREGLWSKTRRPVRWYRKEKS